MGLIFQFRFFNAEGKRTVSRRQMKGYFPPDADPAAILSPVVSFIHSVSSRHHKAAAAAAATETRWVSEDVHALYGCKEGKL